MGFKIRERQGARRQGNEKGRPGKKDASKNVLKDRFEIEIGRERWRVIVVVIVTL